MQAIVDRDIIVAIGRGPVRIPDDYPRDVGWERLRWDGKRIIDLATCSALWVEHTQAGVFVLHAVEVPNSVLVEMTYADRKNLYLNSGTIHIKTAQQIADELLAKQTEAVRTYLASQVTTPKELAELIMVLTGLIALTAIYARTNNATAGAALTAIMPQLQALPLAKIAPLFPNAATTLKDIFELYFTRLEGV